MAQLAMLMAGLLLSAESQASDVADQGVQSKYMLVFGDDRFLPPAVAVPKTSEEPEASETTTHPNYDKFITSNLNRVKRGNEEFLSKIADREEKQAVQKMLTSDSSNSTSACVLGMGLLSLVTMLGVRLWRGMQQATVHASSGGQGLDMPMNTASALGEGIMEMKSQDSTKMNSRAGWGQLSSQTSRPLTVAYAEEGEAEEKAEPEAKAAPKAKAEAAPKAAPKAKAEAAPKPKPKPKPKAAPKAKAAPEPVDLGPSLAMPFLTRPVNLDGTMAGDVGFDPLGLSEIDDLGIDLYWLREAEIKHGRVAMLAATGVIWVEAFGPLPGWPEADGRSQMDVFWDAMEEHPNAIVAALLFITIIEVITGIGITAGRASGERIPGDFKLNPLEFEITEELKLKEIKHCRLAMWAVMGQIGAGLTTHAPAFSNMDNMF